MSEKPTLHVVHFDDDVFELEKVEAALVDADFEVGFELQSTIKVDELWTSFDKTVPDVVLLDVYMEGKGKLGLELAKQVREKYPEVVIIMRSNMDDPTTIRDALSAGANDFISKKSDKGELCLRVYHSYQLARIKISPEDSMSQRDREKLEFVGSTMQSVWTRIPRIINSAISAVFIKGASGSGKEMVADLFAKTLAKTTPFVKVNCGAISENLLESELFGHVKGAFTGATTDRKGYFEVANNGWIFLDEVATLSKSAQVALLRVLENGEVMRVGASKPIKVNVRILTATNEDMKELLKEGAFRTDLWQRMIEAIIEIPPLSQRRNEIPDLVRFFASKMKGGPYQVAQPAIDILAAYDWQQGNIRELRNCLRAMTEFHIDKELTPLSIPEHILSNMDARDEQEAQSKKSGKAAANASIKDSIVLKLDPNNPLDFEHLSDSLLLEVTKILFETHGKLSLRKVSLLIGISRSTLSSKMKNLVKKGLIDVKELNKCVNLGDV